MAEEMTLNKVDVTNDYPPLQITFHGVEYSEAVEQKTRMNAVKLGKFHDRITYIRVAIEAPHRHQHKGGLYHVKIELQIPGKLISVNRNPDSHQAHEDIYVAIRDAFKEARRQLQSHIDKIRKRKKTANGLN